VRNELGPNGPYGPKNRKPWTYAELAEVWRHPDMTAAELAELLPGRTAKAVVRIRARYGRYRDSGVKPICQKCGLHPVWVAAADGKRWGLCRECTLGERAYLARNGKRLADIDNAQRQARFKKSRKDG
jgi:hypothetical protein